MRALRAVRLGCALREEMAELTPRWAKRGYDLDFGAGIALGYATCGEVGFEGRSDYAAIGAVTNLASRLADEATGGQILIAQRLYAEVEDDVDVEPVGEFMLKGFQRPVVAFNVVAVRGAQQNCLRSRARRPGSGLERVPFWLYGPVAGNGLIPWHTRESTQAGGAAARRRVCRESDRRSFGSSACPETRVALAARAARREVTPGVCDLASGRIGASIGLGLAFWSFASGRYS